MSSDTHNEFVLAFPRSLFDELGAFNGLCFDFDKYLGAIGTSYKFIRRKDAETDPAYKQLIPYVVVAYRDKVLSYVRGALLSESRLLNKYSIGFGGHISSTDPTMFGGPHMPAMRRELREEIHVDGASDDRVVAVLNDDSTDVGKVHFGVVHLVVLHDPGVRKKEKSINNLQFLTIGELRGNIDRYETWSRFCIDDMERILSSPER